jgi:hypothetical protein
MGEHGAHASHAGFFTTLPAQVDVLRRSRSVEN